MKIIKSTYGFCPCCECNTKFSSESSWLRDHYLCESCGCIPRERQITYVLQKLRPNWRELVIHESSPGNRGLSSKLSNECAKYQATHYFPTHNLGEIVKGFRNENLQNQTFPDESFDVVITQDVFEHLPDPELAIKEIARTLKKGGVFIATIPLVNKFNKTEQWAKLVEGKVQFLYEPDYHGNPIDTDGSPVFWHFGFDIAGKLQRWSDMESIILNHQITEYGIEAELLEVIVCYKS